MVTIPTPPSGTFGSYKVGASRQKKIPSSYLITAGAIILILAAGYYFFFYQGIDLSLNAPVLSPAPPLTSLEVKVSQMSEFSFDVVDSSFYKSLRIYGVLPIIVDSLGRTNPFIPY